EHGAAGGRDAEGDGFAVGCWVRDFASRAGGGGGGGGRWGSCRQRDRASNRARGPGSGVGGPGAGAGRRAAEESMTEQETLAALDECRQRIDDIDRRIVLI